MPTNRPLALAFALLALSTAAHAQRDTLHYRFTVHAEPGARPTIDVDLTMRGSPTGRTRIVTPTSWGGQDSLWRALSDFTVDAPTRLVADSVTTGAKVVTHVPRALLHVHYTLRQDWTGQMRYPLDHRVVIDSTAIVFNAQNALVFPDRVPNATAVMRATWVGLPSGWTAVGTWGAGTNVSMVVAARDIPDAAFVAGPLREPGRTIGLRAVLTGRWAFSDSAFGRALEDVWARERAFWGPDADAVGDAFVVLLPYPLRGGVGGSAFAGGFVAFADTTVTLPRLASTFAHELFHLWNGRRMRMGLPEGRFKWFSEGLTDYYADRLAREAGVLDDAQYVERVNRVLRLYHTSPALGSTRARVERDYWKDTDVNRLPYQQGYLLALRWGRATDALVRTLYRSASRRETPVTDAAIIASAPVSFRPMVRASIDSFIDQGRPIPAAAEALGGCATLTSVDIAPFDLGFDGDAAVRERIVRGTRADGPAAAVGVRDGMSIERLNWARNDATQPVQLRVRDSTGARDVTYLPRGGRATTVPQYRLTGGGGACAGAPGIRASASTSPP